MAYGQDSLKVRIRVAFGASIAADPATWVWTDVTAWWHTPEDVTIGWGRSSGAEQPETSTLSLTLKNTDGRFTAYDPRSPYWPHVRKWTPIEYDVDLGDGVGWRNRFSGYIRKLPLTWPGASALMALAKVEAVGVLGRLGRGKPPARSALRRTITGSGALAYWPVEDGTDASVAGSAIPAHPPLTVTGVAEFVTLEEWLTRGYTVNYGTAALADLSDGGQLRASLPSDVTTASAAAWTVAVAADPGVSSGRSADLVLAEVATPGGTYVRWRFVVTKVDSHTQIIAYNSAGAATTVVDYNGAFTGLTPWDFSVRQNGANISVGYRWDSSTGGYWATGSIAGTLAGVSEVTVNPTGTTHSSPMPFGHIAVWAGHGLSVVDFNDGDLVLALFGYAWSGFGTANNAATGEPATARLARLAAEDGLTLDMPVADPDAEMMMGWQKPGTPLALYQDCESADQGLIYESGFGLGYLPRSARYNAPVALTIDGAAGQLGMPFDPVDDDQMLRNVQTVQRVDGSTAVAADQQSIDLQGEVEASTSVNLFSDTPLPDHASWRLRLSTVQEPRYPAVSINLYAHPDMAAAWCACKPGSRIQVVNPPAQNVPGTVDQLVVGATETYRGRRSWRATLNVVPASPWQVATVDGEPRVAADGTVTTGLSSAAMSLLISSTPENGVWTEDPADFPLDIRVGGERVTASAIGRSLVDAFGRTVAAGGWGAPWTVSLGDPADVSVNGSVGLIALDTIGDERHMTTDLGAQTQDLRLWVRAPIVPTGAPINEGILLRYVDPTTYIWVDAQINTDSSVTLRLIKRVAGVVTVFASVPSGVTHSTTVDLALRAEVSGGLLRARVWSSGDAEPATWQASVTDGALPTGTWGGAIARRMTGNTNGTVGVRFDNVSVQQPQLVTLSARSVNGVVKAWPAGTEVDVWTPAIVAL